MDPLRSILRNWSLLAGGQVISSLLSMALMVLVSRSLGDIEFGRITLALALATIVGIGIDVGLSQVLTRVLARERTLTRPYLARAAAVLAGVGAVAYVALPLIARGLGYTGEVQLLCVVLGVLMVGEGASTVLTAVFQAHERMTLPAVSRIAANVVALGLAIPLLRGGAPAIAAALTAGTLVRLAILALGVRRLEGFALPAGPTPRWRDLVHAGLPFFAAQGLGMFVVRINVVMLGNMTTEATVGWYGVAARVVEALNFIPLVMTAATFPVLSRLWTADRALYERTARTTLRLMVLVALPISVTLLVLAQDIVGTLFSLATYAQSVPLLRIHSLTLAFVFVDYFLVCALMAAGRERRWIGIVAVACCLNPLLNWILIPATSASLGNGAVGAAIATFLTEIFFFVAAWRAVPAGTFDRSVIRTVAPTIAISAALALALALSRGVGIPWPIAGAAGALAYVAAVVGLRIVPAEAVIWMGSVITSRTGAARESRGAIEVARTEVDAA